MQQANITVAGNELKVNKLTTKKNDKITSASMMHFERGEDSVGSKGVGAFQVGMKRTHEQVKADLEGDDFEEDNRLGREDALAQSQAKRFKSGNESL